MGDILLDWFSLYGLPLVFFALMFGQTGIPMPTSILLLTVGATLNDSAYSPAMVFVTCVAGAAVGDQISYWIGRRGGPAFIDWMRKTRYERLIERAERFSAKWGALSVFLTRWLLPPVSPYLNYVVGVTKLRWGLFSAMAMAGEAVWIALFVALGFTFRQSIAETNDVVVNTAWFVGATVFTIYIGKHFRKAWQRALEKRAANKSTE